LGVGCGHGSDLLLPASFSTGRHDELPGRPSLGSRRNPGHRGRVFDVGFRQADIIIERRYTTKPVHQAYIEPHACIVSTMPDGQVQIWGPTAAARSTASPTSGADHP